MKTFTKYFGDSIVIQNKEVEHYKYTGDFTKYVHTGENAYEGSEALDEAVREYIKIK